MAIVPGRTQNLWENCAPFPKEVFENGQKRYFPPWLRKHALNGYYEYSDQKFMEILLKPKSKNGQNEKIQISFMVATTDTVKTIEVRPPLFQFGRIESTSTPNWMFHPAQIIDQDCNMVLCQWQRGETAFSEWIFKGRVEKFSYVLGVKQMKIWRF